MSKQILNDLKKYSPKVEVRASPIHGKGVFALEWLPKGAAVFLYKGILYHIDNEDITSMYRIDVDEKTILDGQSVESVGKHLNSAYRTGKAANVRVQEYYPAYTLCKHPCYVIRANRDILPGEEFLLNYGQGYWKGLLADRSLMNQDDK
jgi:hypothetical protein